MKAKRLILMMLVMLGSVGAWAQEPEEVFLKLTAIDANPDGLQTSGYMYALDGNNTTIWYDYYTDDMYLEFRTDSPLKVDAYYITTGINTLNGDRNPYGWILKGKTSRTDEWEVLSTVAESDDNLPIEATTRSTAFPITRSEGKAYMYFRFEFTSKKRTQYFQFAELEMALFCTHQYSDDPESGAAYYTCSECGTIAPGRVPGGHVHDYTWAYDTEGHWHQCTFPYGECDAPTNDEKAAHTFNATYTLKCDVCGYVASHTHDYDTEGICKQCGAENLCNHTFNAINDVCDKCSHGFLFYEGTALVQPTGLSILSNSFNDGKGVIETSGSIGSIPNRAFFDCRGLTSITIGNSVETIGRDAFKGCTKLNNIFISCSLKSIGSGAFSAFQRGTLEVMWHNPIPFSDMQFELIPGSRVIQLKVPSTAVENYRAADGWKDCIISTRSHSHTYGNDPSNATAYCTCKTCGYQEHRHAYSTEWSTDATHHWHECTMNFGTCTAKQKDKSAHSYDDNAERGTTAYYTCVCGHIDPVRQHVHHYVTSEVTTEGHVCVCTSEVGECTVPEIRGGHTLEVVDGTYVCSLCGWTHEHNYMWIHDETKHWHECDGEGECNARTKDEAEHNIHESITCDTENYMCDVCQYVDEEKKALFGARDYLSMTAVGGDVTIGFKNQGTPDSYTIQVSEDGNHWSEPQTLNTETTLATIPEGKTYFFRHGSATATNHISSGDSNYWSFTMASTSDDVTVEAGGNIMSLLDATCQQTELPMQPQHVFTKLFLNCGKLTVAPRMDAITAVPQWGFVSMFSGSGIKEAPALSTTHIRDGAYRAMFENCKELASVPALHATKLNRSAYWDMFKGCDKLTSIEIANIESMVVDEGSTDRENSFHDMLAATAVGTNGVIIAPIEMMGDTRITLPSNWQWATKLKANEVPDNDGNFYTTFFDSRYDYKVENGFQAYTGIITTTEGDERELRLTATPDKIIPKGDGVIIHGGSGEVLLTVSDGSAKRVDGNVLTGSDTDTTAPAFCYILSYGQQRLGFYKYEEGKALSAHKAYLTYEPVPGVLAKALRMVFVDDEVDGIENVNENVNENISIYNLSGVRLNKLQKGINIVNGKRLL